MDGVVKWFSKEKNYGFIIGQDDKDYFFHGSEIRNEQQALFQDDEVQFDTEETSKGLSAVNVTRIRN